MEHANHGKHPAQSSEIEDMKKRGWVICPPKIRSIAKAEPAVFAAVEPSVTASEATAFATAKAKADEELHVNAIRVTSPAELEIAQEILSAQEKRKPGRPPKYI